MSLLQRTIDTQRASIVDLDERVAEQRAQLLRIRSAEIPALIRNAKDECTRELRIRYDVERESSARAHAHTLATKTAELRRSLLAAQSKATAETARAHRGELEALGARHAAALREIRASLRSQRAKSLSALQLKSKQISELRDAVAAAEVAASETQSRHMLAVSTLERKLEHASQLLSSPPKPPASSPRGAVENSEKDLDAHVLVAQQRLVVAERQLARERENHLLMVNNILRAREAAEERARDLEASLRTGKAERQQAEEEFATRLEAQRVAHEEAIDAIQEGSEGKVQRLLGMERSELVELRAKLRASTAALQAGEKERGQVRELLAEERVAHEQAIASKDSRYRRLQTTMERMKDAFRIAQTIQATGNSIKSSGTRAKLVGAKGVPSRHLPAAIAADTTTARASTSPSPRRVLANVGVSRSSPTARQSSSLQSPDTSPSDRLSTETIMRGALARQQAVDNALHALVPRRKRGRVQQLAEQGSPLLVSSPSGASTVWL